NAVQLQPAGLEDALDACRSRNTTDDALVALRCVAVLADRAIAADLREGAIAVNERIIGCVVCEDIPSRTVDSALNVIGYDIPVIEDEEGSRGGGPADLILGPQYRRRREYELRLSYRVNDVGDRCANEARRAKAAVEHVKALARQEEHAERIHGDRSCVSA